MTQKAITNFFKPLQVENSKRKVIEDISSSNKRLCTLNQNSPTNNESVQKQNFSKQFPRIGSRKVLSGYFEANWHHTFEKEFSKPYFKNLEQFITSERKLHTIYPPEEDVFRWTLLCDIDKVKVVILGQDPYHGPKQANGLAFSVKKGVAKPPSLINIFREVQNDYPDFVIPSHGDLDEWAKQGVLLLNSCLTVRANQANSHANKGWEQFTDAVIKYLNNHFDNLVFLLWGSYAQKKGDFINQKKHLVLKSVHPSPLSASRGFFGCGHFKKANEYLEKHKISPINWIKLV